MNSIGVDILIYSLYKILYQLNFSYMFLRRKEQLMETAILGVFLLCLIMAIGYAGYSEQQDEIFIYNNL